MVTRGITFEEPEVKLKTVKPQLLSKKIKNWTVKVYGTGTTKRPEHRDMIFIRARTKSEAAEYARQQMVRYYGKAKSIESIEPMTRKIEDENYYSMHPLTLGGKRKYYLTKTTDNPGEAWHHNRYNSAFQRAYDPKLTLGSQQIAGGMAEEAMQSEKESRRLGIPNPSKKSKLLRYAIVGGLVYWLWKKYSQSQPRVHPYFKVGDKIIRNLDILSTGPPFEVIGVFQGDAPSYGFYSLKVTTGENIATTLDVSDVDANYHIFMR